ncbi:MAG: metallophosphoesterase family protein [bacterium]
MRIAVISDTHGVLPEKMIPSLRSADEIWHLGDFCTRQVFESCLALGRPFHAVRGNNDFFLELPLFLEITRFGKTFHLVHIQPRRLPVCDFLLFGHTHVPCDTQTGSVRLLNPGTVGKPNKGAPPSWAWLDVTEQGGLKWSLNRV